MRLGSELPLVTGQVVDRVAECTADLADRSDDPVALLPGGLDPALGLLVARRQAPQDLFAVLLGLGHHGPALLDRPLHLCGGHLPGLGADAFGLGQRRVTFDLGRLADRRGSRLGIRRALAEHAFGLVEQLGAP